MDKSIHHDDPEHWLIQFVKLRFDTVRHINLTHSRICRIVKKQLKELIDITEV